MSFRCTLCDREFDASPNDAIQVGKAKACVAIYRFANGEIHRLVSTKLGAKKNARVKESEL